MIVIGRVRRAVGLDGRLEVELHSGDLSRLANDSVVMVGSREFKVEKATPGRKGLFNVRFEGVKDRDKADTLRGADIAIPESKLPQTPEGTYYHYQIVGLSVVDKSGRQIGSVSGIMETGANDVYVVSTGSNGEGKEILIPATRNCIEEIDIVRKVITVVLPTDIADRSGEEDQD